MVEIKTGKKKDVLVVELVGRLDAATAPLLEKNLADLLDKGERSFLVDMREMDYISSVGLRVLLVLAKKTKAISGDVLLCSLQEQVHEVFEISGFTTIFSIYADQNEALDSL